MEIIDLTTLRLSILLTSIVCVFALITVWRINSSLPGILQMMVGLSLNLLAFLVGLAASIGLISAALSLWLTNILSLAAIAVLFEGILRFRGFISPRRWQLIFILIPLFAVLAWVNLDNVVRRYLFHDAIATLTLMASAIVMVWRTRSRDELLTYGVAGIFSLLMAASFAARWFTAASADADTDFVSATILLYVGIMVYMVGLSFGIVAACYFKSHQSVLKLASEDALTGLPNRRSIDLALKHYLSLAERQEKAFAIVVMDLDRFKQVNDTLGHSVGDTLLVEVADRIRLFVRESDFAGRLGGDEFLLILADIPTLDAADSAAGRLRQCVEGVMSAQGHPLTIQVSLGVACWPLHANTLEQLLRIADQNMYEEKAARSAAA